MNWRFPEISKKLFEELLDRALELTQHHKFMFNNPLHAIAIQPLTSVLRNMIGSITAKTKGR